MFLYRLAITTRWHDCEVKFGLTYFHLSEIFWEITETFLQKFGDKLSLRSEYLQSRSFLYADAIHRAGSALSECVGFIDCTRIKIQRPSGSNVLQRSCFSGHTRIHCLIYQTLSTPDGLIFALFGPLVGRRHDLTLLRESNWESHLEEHLLVDDRQFYIFGDAAYNLKPWLQKPFNCNNLSPLQRQFNSSMSAVRVAVEHGYKEVKLFWTSQDFSRKLKVKQAPIGLLYRSSVLMWNMRVCFYGCGQVTEKFGVDPPTIEEHLAV